MKQLERSMGRMVMRMASLMCLITIILHLFACVFHFVTLWRESDTSWVEASGIVDTSSLLDRCAFSECHGHRARTPTSQPLRDNNSLPMLRSGDIGFVSHARSTGQSMQTRRAAKCVVLKAQGTEECGAGTCHQCTGR
jgi:hypothetical protein